jgi:peptidoglycan-associated lipoprotein
MLHARTTLALAAGGLLLALSSGCAAPNKNAKSSKEILDATPVATTPVTAPDPGPTIPAGTTTAETPPACTLALVHFDFDSSQLDDGSRQALQAVATCLKQKQAASVVIEGHCDERGTEAYNLALGKRRASAVKAYLGDLGVTTPMQMVSFGKDQPIAEGHGEEAWRQNRRAEFRLGDRRSSAEAESSARVAGR